MSEKRFKLPTVEDFADTLAWIDRTDREVRQEAAPKPWIVDVSQQRRPKHAPGHRRVK